jgi:membrane dipeptidase
VEGFDALIRRTEDLDRLPRLFDRGVRLFQPVCSSSNVLAGSASAGDERGLTELGRSFLQSLADLGSQSSGPRPILDLAHLNPRSMSEILDWFESDANRLDRVLLVYSHGALWHPGFDTPRALSWGNLARLRALGGVVGLSVSRPFYSNIGSLKDGIDEAAALPFLGRVGYDGIAIGTDFLGVDATVPLLGNASNVVDWLASAFDPESSAALIAGNAGRLLECAVGTVHAP